MHSSAKTSSIAICSSHPPGCIHERGPRHSGRECDGRILTPRKKEHMNMGKPRWSLAHIVLALFVLILFAQTGALPAFAEERRVVKLPGTETLPFSDGVIAGDTLYVAGQEGIDDKGK